MDNEKELTRTQLHERAMICLYQYLFYAQMKKELRNDINKIVEDEMEESFESCNDFFKEILFLAIKNRKEYIGIISEHLSKTWTYKRLNLIEQAILLLFTSEIINNQVEIHVGIDVAVDLTKKYCDDNSYKFINAVLDKIAKEYGQK